MKQKGRRAAKSLASMFLVFAMVIGLLSGPVFVKQTAQAAGEGTIELGKLENHGTYYTYPNATVKMSDESKKFYDLSVTVDSGYFKIPQSRMLQETSKAMGILSDGSVAGNYMGSDDKFAEVSIDNEYASIVFSWEKSKQITKDLIEDFIKRIQFVTTASSSQVVSICATTLNDDEKVVNVDGSNIYLKFFNGHFYGGGWAAPSKTWDQASKLCKEAEFGGVKGYLATITSRAEDRFIYTNFFNASGWLGCTRAKLEEGSSYDDPDPKWQPVVPMEKDRSNAETDFVWRWVTGPETGTEFGYQTQSEGWDPKSTGGFHAYDNQFANWGTMEDGDGFAEPNGGGGTFPMEGFGYYGQYDQGRWNDHKIDDNHVFYIEFGGYPGDEQKLKDNLGDVIYSATKDSADDSDDPINDGKDDREDLRGDVEIINRDPYGNCTAGSPLEADITDILNKNADWDLDPDHDLIYQWYTQENEGVQVPIEGATDKTYTLTDSDLGKKIIVWVTVEKEDENGDMQKYTAESPALNTSVKGDEGQKVKIGGAVVIEETGKDGQNNPILEANIDGITPEGVKPVLNYQWYIYNPEEDIYEKIEDATDPTYTVPEENQGKQIVVTVTPDEIKGEGYEGSVTSMPYTVTEKDNPKEPIKGVVIINNLTTDDEGEPINKAGSVLSANIDGVEPEGSHPTLTYQWYVTDDNGVFQKIPGAVDKNYILTENDIDRKVAVTAYADEENYTGSVSSLPYDTKRTNADIGIDPNPSGDPDDIWRIITITPTAQDTTYTVWEFGTAKTPDYVVVTDEEGTELQPDEDGYYKSDLPGGILNFKVRKDTAYDIKEKLTIHSNTETLGSHIDDDDIKTDYDNKTDTISITVDPAKTDYQYAVLKKVDGKWEPIPISRQESDYVYDPDSSQVWSDGGDDIVSFTKLPADGTYRIVTIPTELEDGRNPDDIDPSVILDGSKEIDASDVKQEKEGLPIEDPKTSYDKTTDTITIAVDPAKGDYQYAILKKDGNDYKPVTVTQDKDGNYIYDEKGTTIWSTGDQNVVTYTKLPADGTYRIVAVPVSAGTGVKPGGLINGSKDIDGSKVKQDALGSQNPNTTQYTKAEEDKAEKFIKDYVTDAKKKLITKVDDSTRDIIISGEATWKKMTAREKAAVNAKLKAKGCPYTYEQLLAMAKKWKIPSFNMKKVMKKGTKSTVKMVKCKGATIITTTSNKKVGTISKKGVIKAKKVGKANLTITAIKGKYTNRLTIRLVVRKKFKNAKELKKLKAKQIKTPTLLLNKQRKLNKSTKIGIIDLNKKSKVTYKSLNKKNFTINKKGRYKAKRLGSSLIRTTVKQNNKTYILYLYLTGIK